MGRGSDGLEGEWTPIARFSMDSIMGMQNGGHVCMSVKCEWVS